jgi:hypothetical protein
MDQLKEIWQEAGYPAAQRLYDLSKKKGLSFTQKQVSDFVKGQETYQLHAPAPKPAVSHPITTSAPNVEWQIDLLDMSKYNRQNAGHHWILLVEDVFSRKAYAEAIKNKQPTSVLPALQNAVEKLGKPLAIISDNGNEFEGVVNKWMEESNIARRRAAVGDHRVLGVIDSLSRFFKNALHRHFTHTQTTHYLNYLPTLVQSYNNTPHTSLNKMTPDEAVNDQTATREIHYANATGVQWKPKFKVGQRVRLLKRKQTFGRGYEVRFSIKVYTIQKIDGVNYVLDDGTRAREFMLIDAGGKPKINKEEEKSAEEKMDETRDVAKEAKFEHQTEQLLKQEGVSQSNRREGLRERKPQSQLHHPLFGNVKW